MAQVFGGEGNTVVCGAVAGASRNSGTEVGSSTCVSGDTVAGEDEPAEHNEEMMGLKQFIVTCATIRRTCFAMRQPTVIPSRQ